MNGFACQLPGEAIIHLRGSKIPEFLQGQLSCDTRLLSTSRSVCGAFCNVKGRVLSDLRVIAVSDSHVLLRLRRSVAQEIAGALQRYAQFSRIAVDVGTDSSIVGLLRSDDMQTLLPEAIDATRGEEHHIALRCSADRGELIALDSEGLLLFSQRYSDASEADTEHWQAQELSEGHYAIEPDDSGEFTPQTLNYDRTARVAFDKGCYTGQEVIARLHYKGRSKRRLQVFEVSGTVPPYARGSALVNTDEKRVATALRQRRTRQGTHVLAAELDSDLLGRDLLLADGRSLTALAPDSPA